MVVETTNSTVIEKICLSLCLLKNDPSDTLFLQLEIAVLKKYSVFNSN